MKKLTWLLFCLNIYFLSKAQNDLPRYLSPQESKLINGYNLQRNSGAVFNSGNVLPPASPVRTIAEWEELQGFTVTWTSYTSILREIVRYAKTETRVYIIVATVNERTNAINYLASGNVDTVNVSFIITPYNSVWSRDYGMWSAYTNDVDTLITVDWIYNRPRPKDDTAHYAISNLLGTPLYKTYSSPWDLVHTGGNFMTDGFGTAFSSNLLLHENNSSQFNVYHSPAEIDTILKHFMGINRNIVMDTLPYDVIHHIDMHMKLLDEETILMGEYPPGVADGPQIEANLLYVINNFNSVYGTPYKVIRIPMPPTASGQYPPTGNYYTYTNSSFINKTIIVPIYNRPQDTTALRIYREALPGYTVVGINSLQSIGALGALHCITKEIATDDPLLISHQKLEDTYDQTNPYTVNALMKHRSGIATANLYYRTDTLLPYNQAAMTYTGSNDIWTANIPAQIAGTTVYYYVEANANSGKLQVRPMPAPTGYWHFDVLSTASVSELENATIMNPPFPNPSKGITCIPANFQIQTNITVTLEDLNGKIIETIFEGKSRKGDNYFFTDTKNHPAGVYLIRLQTPSFSKIRKLIVR